MNKDGVREAGPLFRNWIRRLRSWTGAVAASSYSTSYRQASQLIGYLRINFHQFLLDFEDRLWPINKLFVKFQYSGVVCFSQLYCVLNRAR